MLMTAQDTESRDVVSVAVAGRPWRCASGIHVLGVVRRENHANQLHLTDGHVIVGSAQVWCPICESFRDWHAGQDAIDHLLQRRGRSPTI